MVIIMDYETHLEPEPLVLLPEAGQAALKPAVDPLELFNLAAPALRHPRQLGLVHLGRGAVRCVSCCGPELLN